MFTLGVDDDRRPGWSWPRSPPARRASCPIAWGHLVATAAVLWSFAIAVCLFAEQLLRPATERAVSKAPCTRGSPWGRGSFQVGLLVDQLSILFAMLITAWVAL
jgi:hypothetical protein